MCKIYSFCITVGQTSLSGTQIGQTNVQTGLTNSYAFNGAFLGPQVGDSATVPLKEDKAEL
jgi:hypothetical protein